MAKISGKATIRVDGVELKTENGAKLSPGGINRNPEAHGGNTYFTEEDVVPVLECNVLHDKDMDAIFLSGITGATVMFEADTGQTYVMRDAFTTEPVPVDTNSGKSALKMSGETVDKV